MSRLFALLLALLLPLSLTIGCATSGGGDDDDSVDGDDDDTTGDDDTAGDDDDSTPAPEGAVSGRVVDLVGAPLEDIGVSCCSEEMCLTSSTDAAGDFTISGLNANTYVIDNLGYPGTDPQNAAMEWSKFFEFVPVASDVQVTVSHDLVLPQVAEAQQVSSGANSLSYAGGLSVSFDGSDLDVPFLVADITPLTLGAIELEEPDAWPVGGLDGHEVLRAWSFAPFELGLKSGGHISVSITMSEALASGTTASLMWADYSEGVETEQFESASATVSSDGLTVDGEIEKLSLLLLVRPTS